MLSTEYQPSVSILKWGNSQCVRLTTDVLRRAKLGVSDQVVIHSEPGRIVIELAKPKVLLADLLAKIPEGQALALVDFGDAVGREQP
jgi:antitoxin component of MazEF toxin-antitoxin module